MDALVICSECQSLNRVDLSRSKDQPVCGRCKKPLSQEDGVQEVTNETLKALIKKSPRPVVVDFWAPWCAPCRGFAPSFREVSKNFSDKMIFAKLNTESDPSAGEQFQIKGIPTLIVFSEGAEVDRKTGAMPLEMLTSYIKKALSL